MRILKVICLRILWFIGLLLLSPFWILFGIVVAVSALFGIMDADEYECANVFDRSATGDDLTSKEKELLGL